VSAPEGEEEEGEDVPAAAAAAEDDCTARAGLKKPRQGPGGVG